MPFEKPVYIAKYIKTDIDDDGVERAIYDTPKLFYLNHQPISNYLDYQEYGADISSIRRAYPRKEYAYGKIHAKDRAYLIDEENVGTDLEELVKNETERCLNANYEVVKCPISRLFVQIDFRKIEKKGKR